ncbi:MAG: hypothetical protein V1703_02305 [Candidatus Altiarchaeota archaeon]
MLKVAVHPWASAGGQEAWNDIFGPDELKKFRDAAAAVDPLKSNGATIRDRLGRKFTVRVFPDIPIIGNSWAETYLNGMQVSAKTSYRFTAMCGDTEAAKVGMIKVDDGTIRSISAEVDRSYTGGGLFSVLCKEAYYRYPKGMMLQGGVGSIETLLFLASRFSMVTYVRRLPEDIQRQLSEIELKAQALRKKNRAS